MIRTGTLEVKTESLFLAPRDDRLPQVVSSGPRLPSGEARTLAGAGARDIAGGMLDRNPDLSICPEASQTLPGRPGLFVRALDDTPLAPRFPYVKSRTEPGAFDLVWRFHDRGLTYRAKLALDPETIAACATIEDDKAILLDWLAAPVFPAGDACLEMIGFFGRWCDASAQYRVPRASGIRLRENHTGRTGQEHLPLLYLPHAGANISGGQRRARTEAYPA